MPNHRIAEFEGEVRHAVKDAASVPVFSTVSPKVSDVAVFAPAGMRDRSYRVADPKSMARLMTSYELATPDQVDTRIRAWGEFRL